MGLHEIGKSPLRLDFVERDRETRRETQSPHLRVEFRRRHVEEGESLRYERGAAPLGTGTCALSESKKLPKFTSKANFSQPK